VAFIESSVKHSLSSATSSSSTASGEVVCVPQTEERQSIGTSLLSQSLRYESITNLSVH
jgi:hypothetical protein